MGALESSSAVGDKCLDVHGAFQGVCLTARACTHTTTHEKLAVLDSTCPHTCQHACQHTCQHTRCLGFAYIGMVDISIAYIVMAYIVMAYIVMAFHSYRL